MNEGNHHPLIGQTKQGFVIWLTGLPASGKSSLAEAIKRMLSRSGMPVVIIDSDDMRQLLTPHPTYEPAERDRFYAAIGDLAVWLSGSGINVLIAATANKRCYRDELRNRIDQFVEILVDCPIEECRARDPKGIYARASTDDANQVPGMGAAYEPPLDPELAIDTGRLFPRHAAYLVLEKLVAMEILPSDLLTDIPRPSRSVSVATAKK